MNSKQRRISKRKFDAEWPYKCVLPYDHEFYRFKNHMLYNRVVEFRTWLKESNIQYLNFEPSSHWREVVTFYFKNEKDLVWAKLKWS
jgi:hypothetical protein